MQALSTVAAAIAATILGALGGLHLYWALGGKFGKNAAIPTRNGKPVLRPSGLGTGLVAVALFAMVALLAISRGWIDLPALHDASRLGAAITALAFGIRAIGDFRYVGFFKRIRDGRFARLDTNFYSPLCVILAELIGLAIT